MKKIIFTVLGTEILRSGGTLGLVLGEGLMVDRVMMEGVLLRACTCRNSTPESGRNLASLTLL